MKVDTSLTKMKLCFLRRNTTLSGGAENYLRRLSSELTRQGVTHRVINSDLPRALPSWLHAIIYNFIVCKNKSGNFYFSLERVTCPDIYRAGDGVHREYLRHKRVSLNPLNPVYLYLEKRCFNNAKRIIVNSEMVKHEIISHYKIKPEKITLVYPGVDSTLPSADETSIRNEFNIDEGTPIILFVGSGFARKGVGEMLNLLAKVERNFVSIIVGKDKRIAHYKTMAKKLKIQGKTIFTGTRLDTERFYRESDILLFPTRYEPFSNVVIEAMSTMNAVITTRQNGASEVIQNRLIMDTPDDVSILPEINRLLDDEDYLIQIKEENYNKSQSFTIEKSARQTLDVIREVAIL